MNNNISDLRVLVTGGAGFIGSHIVDLFLKQGANVQVIDNFSTGKQENLLVHQTNTNLKIKKGDLSLQSWVTKQIRDFEPHIIFHQAALVSVQKANETPIIAHENNITNTLYLLEIARKFDLSKIVYASSSAVYGDLPGYPKREEMPTAPLSPYGVTKLSGESYMQAYFKVYGLPTVSLRYFNVYGPRQGNSPYSGVIALFIRRIIENHVPLIYGSGNQSRDFVYVKDVAHANLLAGINPNVKGQIYNVASGKPTTINELSQIIRKQCNFHQPCRYEKERDGDIFSSIADISLIQQDLAWSPIYELEKGLKETIDWYKSH